MLCCLRQITKRGRRKCLHYWYCTVVFFGSRHRATPPRLGLYAHKRFGKMILQYALPGQRVLNKMIITNFALFKRLCKLRILQPDKIALTGLIAYAVLSSDVTLLKKINRFSKSPM